jgi:glycosyltransferase involved in cell wall biosynthesis
MNADLIFFQHGDFLSAYQKFCNDREDVYRDQRKSVDFVTALSINISVCVVSFSDNCYNIQITPKLQVIGIKFCSFNRVAIRSLLDELKPKLVVCRAPHPKIIREVSRRGIFLLPCFADIFSNASLRKIIRNIRLHLSLRGALIPCFSNHSLNASRSMRSALFYPANRIVPWDWSRVPLGGEAKLASKLPGALRIFFAGALTEDKGVGDCLEALALLRQDGVDGSMTFAGSGDIEAWKARAGRLGLCEVATFVGMISNQDVRRQMREHDAVVVPSRHTYAEGLPNTIYEGLASRSPLVISDHPAFHGRIRPETECLIFPAAHPKALAEALARIAKNPTLYRTLSENSAQAVEGLYIGMEWERLIEAFIEDPENRTGWVQVNSLEALDH